MENPVHGGRATYFPNEIPGEGMPADLPGGGMPGPSGDEDGNAGALPEPAYPQHCDHNGEGNPPPHLGCARCDMMVPWQDLNIRHPATAQCA